MDTVDLLVTIEKKFIISIEDKEAETIETVGDYYQVIKDKLGASDKRGVIYIALIQVIADFSGVSENKISDSTNIAYDLGLD